MNTGGQQRRDPENGSGPMDCNVLVELVTNYLDGALDMQTRTRLDTHLLDCDGCQNYLEQFRVTVATVGRIRPEDIDPVYRNRILHAFRDWLELTPGDEG